MNKEQQIEEMNLDISYSCIDLVESGCGDNNCPKCLAEQLYEAGYRKVPDGEWILVQNGQGICSVCNRQDNIDNLAHFCRYCGARMKDGEQE